VPDRVGVACKEIFSWFCVYRLITVQKDNFQLFQSIIVFWTIKGMKMHCFGMTNFLVLNKCLINLINNEIIETYFQ